MWKQISIVCELFTPHHGKTRIREVARYEINQEIPVVDPCRTDRAYLTLSAQVWDAGDGSHLRTIDPRPEPGEANKPGTTSKAPLAAGMTSISPSYPLRSRDAFDRVTEKIETGFLNALSGMSREPVVSAQDIIDQDALNEPAPRRRIPDLPPADEATEIENAWKEIPTDLFATLRDAAPYLDLDMRGGPVWDIARLMYLAGKHSKTTK